MIAPALQVWSLLNEHAVTVQVLIPVRVAMTIAPRVAVGCGWVVCLRVNTERRGLASKLRLC